MRFDLATPYDEKSGGYSIGVNQNLRKWVKGKKNTSSECQKLCQETDGCKVFNWYTDKVCALKSTFTGKVVIISGKRNCPGKLNHFIQMFNFLIVDIDIKIFIHKIGKTY